MAYCLKCRKYFREPPDEEGDHDCPYCGGVNRGRRPSSIAEAIRLAGGYSRVDCVSVWVCATTGMTEKEVVKRITEGYFAS